MAASALLALALGTVLVIPQRDVPAAAARLVEARAGEAEEAVRAQGLAVPSRIVIVLYGTHGAFARAAGEGGAIAAKWDDRVLRLPVDAASAATLRHELAHAAIHARAGRALPRWVDEGLAVLAEGDPSRYASAGGGGWLRQPAGGARKGRASGPASSFDALDAALAARSPSTAAYLEASRLAARAAARAGGVPALVDLAARDPLAAQRLAVEAK